VARSNYDSVLKNGLQISSIDFGNHTVRPAQVLRSPDDSEYGFDFIVCTNKALQPHTLPDALKSVVKPKSTTIVLIQNGVGAEDYVRTAFPDNTIISCVTWVGAKQVDSGVVEHFNGNSMTMGVFWNSIVDRGLEMDRIGQLEKLLKQGGTQVEIVDDIISKRWEKVVWNAAWNSYTALTMLDTKQFLGSSDEALLVSRRLMTEIVSVAQAAGINVQMKLVDDLIDKTLKSKGLTSSMMMDLANGRPMEVEGILGTPMRTARKVGVSTPTLDCIYVLIKAQDWRVRNVSKV
jgi:2-dehydropantoate 2-reductase